MRLLILRTMLHTSQAVSLLDLVDMLETADKSTVSRTLSRARRRLYKCLRYGL